MESFSEGLYASKLCPTAGCSVKSVQREVKLLRGLSGCLRETMRFNTGGLICDVMTLKIQGYIESGDELSLRLYSFLWGLQL